MCLYLAILDKLGNLDGQVIRVRLVGQLSDDQAGTSMDFLDVDHGAHGNRTATGAVRILDTFGAQNLRTGREVRALDTGDESVQ